MIACNSERSICSRLRSDGMRCRNCSIDKSPFLVSSEQSFNAFANLYQLLLHNLLAFFGWIGRTRCCQPTIEFLLYQGRVFQQADHVGPDNLVEQVLSNEAAVVANRTAQFSPAIGANALVVVDLTRARARRCTREGVATLLTADQPLHNTRLDGAPARSNFVFLEKLLSTGETLFANQGWHRDLDPFFARPFVTYCHTGHSDTPPTLWAHHAAPR